MDEIANVFDDTDLIITTGLVHVVGELLQVFKALGSELVDNAGQKLLNGWSRQKFSILHLPNQQQHLTFLLSCSTDTVGISSSSGLDCKRRVRPSLVLGHSHEFYDCTIYP